jgi:small GTP-binding protein
MKNQPIINIGCLGSVSDGKSTLVEKLTGIKTQRHSNEKDRNITIKQGYGNMKIWFNNINSNYYSTDSTYNNLIIDNNPTELVNHISFVDCPGHQDLIKTLLSSISLMDGVIIVIAVNQSIDKKRQLIEQLKAIKLCNFDKIIICLNKIDLISKSTLLLRKKELDDILLKFDIKPFSIIPTCFNKKIGLDNLLISIMNLFNSNNYKNKVNDNVLFRITRTFDINKPGTKWSDVKGGVIGGALISGSLKIGDIIEIKPGYISKNDKGEYSNTILKTKILSLKTENNNMDCIIPGGLIGIGTDIDPFYCKNDILVGNICSIEDNINNIYNEINIKINNNIFNNNWIPIINEIIILQIGNKSYESQIIDINNDILKFKLFHPCCIYENMDDNIIICKNNLGILEIITNGIIKK